MSEATLRQLECVFPDGRPLQGDDITSHFCAECEEIQQLFAGKRWRDFLRKPYELLGYFHREPKIVMSRDSLCLLTPEAFVYFLPVFLSAIVTDPTEADVMIDAMASQFDPGPKKDLDDEEQWNWREERAREHLSLMTQEQREVVAAALERFKEGDEGTRYSAAIENLKSGQPTAWKKDEKKRGA